MSYQIRCDNFILDDYRDDELTVLNPMVNLEVNTAGSCSFTIHKNHPYYDKLQKMKSVFEVSDEVGVIFRGRMLDDTVDVYQSKSVNLEGALAYFNDSIIRPFSFPEDFVENSEYVKAAESGNVVKFFLQWLINRHNEQTQTFQRFRLGEVTVSDPNNYISRSSENYASTWDTLKGKLFDSALGGYLCIRYEPDGNYIDYLSDFTLINTQEIVFGENLQSLQSKVSASVTYTAMLPIGADVEEELTGDDGETYTIKRSLTIESIPDGNITDDIVKNGDMIYSKSAVQAFGWVCAPVSESSWDDVTDARNLCNKATATLSGDMSMLSNTMDITALDLHFTDKQIRSFRLYRKVKVRSDLHGQNGTYQLTRLSLNLHSPQSTIITVGKAWRSLVDINTQKETETINRIQTVEKDIAENRTSTIEVYNRLTEQETKMVNTATEIVMSALESYVETGTIEEFRQTLSAELAIWAEGITGRVTAAENRIENVDGDLQAKFNQITKYFTFDINGLLIGALDENGKPSPNKVIIDNDEITIMVGNSPVQKFDANGNAMIPALTVSTMLNVLGLQITEDDTHINCDYVGVVLNG